MRKKEEELKQNKQKRKNLKVENFSWKFKLEKFIKSILKKFSKMPYCSFSQKWPAVLEFFF